MMAIQSLDWLGTLSMSKRLDCFVASLLAMTEYFNRAIGIMHSVTTITMNYYHTVSARLVKPACLSSVALAKDNGDPVPRLCSEP